MHVHYISPFSVEKNIGKAINIAVDQFSKIIWTEDHNDWICLTDYDVLWLLPDTKAHLENILLSQDEFGMLGCMTNRIRSKEQLVGGRFNEDDRIREHMKIAADCWHNAGPRIVEAHGALGAFMLCFKCDVWDKIGGFTENSITFDAQFCAEARKYTKVGIMQGIYVWHSYRLWSNHPKQEINHLIKTN